MIYRLFFLDKPIQCFLQLLYFYNFEKTKNKQELPACPTLKIPQIHTVQVDTNNFGACTIKIKHFPLYHVTKSFDRNKPPVPDKQAIHVYSSCSLTKRMKLSSSVEDWLPAMKFQGDVWPMKGCFWHRQTGDSCTFTSLCICNCFAAKESQIIRT